MHLTVGQVAKEAEVNIETLRYYERKRLLPKPLRSRSGYRQYTRETVAKIRFIKRAQALGFSLQEISELLSLRTDRALPCREVKERAQTKITDIQSKIRDLQRMKKVLSQLVSECDGEKPINECPILESLKDGR